MAGFCRSRGLFLVLDEVYREFVYDGHRSLGFPDAGRIEVGRRADLVTIDATAPRTAGTGADENTAVFAAAAEDVTQVMVDGRVVVRQGDRHEIGRELDAAIDAIWRGMS